MRAARYRRSIRTADVSFPERALAGSPPKAAHLVTGVNRGMKEALLDRG